MMGTTPAAARSTTGNPLSAGTNRPFTTDNLGSPDKPWGLGI